MRNGAQPSAVKVATEVLLTHNPNAKACFIDQIGGWSRKGVGESYGRGYQVEQLWGWLARAVG